MCVFVVELTALHQNLQFRSEFITLSSVSSLQTNLLLMLNVVHYSYNSSADCMRLVFCSYVVELSVMFIYKDCIETGHCIHF